MKRFTETSKWSKPWFLGLSQNHKLLWLYLCDNCDAAGVIDLDYGLVSFQVGFPVSLDDMIAFGERVARLDLFQKFWLVSFIEFQYGTLSRDCRPQQHVFKSLEKHGLLNRVLDSLSDRVLDRVQEEEGDKEEDKDKEKEAERDGKRTLTDRWCAAFKEANGFAYVFSGAKDGKAADALLKIGLPIDEIIALAVKAWKSNGFWAKQSATLAGFASRINEIRYEQHKPTSQTNRDDSIGGVSRNTTPSLRAAALTYKNAPGLLNPPDVAPKASGGHT